MKNIERSNKAHERLARLTKDNVVNLYHYSCIDTQKYLKRLLTPPEKRNIYKRSEKRIKEILRY